MHPVRSKQDSRILNPSLCWNFSKSQSCKECPEMHHLQWTREENTDKKKALRFEWLAWNWTRSLTRGFHFISCYLATTYPSEIPAEEGGGWGLGTIIKVFNIITLPIYTSLQGSRIMVTLCWLETWQLRITRQAFYGLPAKCSWGGISCPGKAFIWRKLNVTPSMDYRLMDGSLDIGQQRLVKVIYIHANIIQFLWKIFNRIGEVYYLHSDMERVIVEWFMAHPVLIQNVWEWRNCAIIQVPIWIF